MPRFTIEGPGVPALELESENWMTALGEALDRFEIHGSEAAGVECDVLDDGDISVRTPNAQFTIHEVVETIARIRVGPETRRPSSSGPRLRDVSAQMGGAPSPLDAPDPSVSRAFRVIAESSETILKEIHTRAALLRGAESVEAAAGAALDLLMEFVPAESGAVLLSDASTRDLCFVAARGPRSRGLVGRHVPAGKGIAGLTVRSGIALTVREAQSDPRHYAEVDQKTGYRTAAILCVPLRGPRGIVGCLELLNPFAGTEFAPWHQSATILGAAGLTARIG